MPGLLIKVIKRKKQQDKQKPTYESIVPEPNKKSINNELEYFNKLSSSNNDQTKRTRTNNKF
jgi:hypothetical protein